MNDAISIAVLGDNKSRKTNFINKKIKNTKLSIKELTQGNCYITDITLKDLTKFPIKVWDTSGQDDYKSLRDKYILSTEAFIVLFSLTDPNSFEYAKETLNDISILRQSNFKAVLVGNDATSPNRQLSYDVGKELADKYHIRYTEISIDNDDNVDEVFEIIFSYYIDRNSIESSPKEKSCCRI